MKPGISMEIVNLNYQEPNRNRRESKYFWDELYVLVAAAGFDIIEIPYEPKWDFGGRSGIPLTARSIKTKFKTAAAYLDTLNKAGIKQVVGLHLDPSLFIGANVDMYFGAFSHFAKEAIVFAKDIGATYVTLTPTPRIYALQSICPSEISWPRFAEDFLSKTSQVIEELAGFAEQNGIKLCLKNEFWTLLHGDKIFPFTKKLKNKVFWDADTAYLQIAGVDPLQLIRDNLSLIGCIHMTDTSFMDKDQCSKPMPEFPADRPTQAFRDLGYGIVDLPAIFDYLKQADYRGPVICNSRQTRDPYRTLLRTRSYINTKLSFDL